MLWKLVVKEYGVVRKCFKNLVVGKERIIKM